MEDGYVEVLQRDARVPRSLQSDEYNEARLTNWTPETESRIYCIGHCLRQGRDADKVG